MIRGEPAQRGQARLRVLAAARDRGLDVAHDGPGRAKLGHGRGQAADGTVVDDPDR